MPDVFLNFTAGDYLFFLRLGTSTVLMGTNTSATAYLMLIPLAGIVYCLYYLLVVKGGMNRGLFVPAGFAISAVTVTPALSIAMYDRIIEMSLMPGFYGTGIAYVAMNIVTAYVAYTEMSLMLCAVMAAVGAVLSRRRGK